jgi:hypothetical protein
MLDAYYSDGHLSSHQDILVDQDWKPHLLEVNHTPSLSPHTQLENGIKSAMLHDLFAMVDIAGNEFQNIIEETDTKYQALVQYAVIIHFLVFSPDAFKLNIRY